MIFRFLFICVFFVPLFVGSFGQSFGAGGGGSGGGSCQIESTPIPELAEYSRRVEKEIQQITAKSNNPANCGITNTGASASVMRAVSALDEAWIRLPVFDNTITDFNYNVRMFVKGQARNPVIRDAQIFTRVETRITAAIQAIAQNCNVNDTNNTALSDLLWQNTLLENIYKQTAAGTPIFPNGDLTPENQKLATAINQGYNSTATEGCKMAPQDIQSISEAVGIFQKKFTQFGKKNEGAFDNWKKGLALFRGRKNFGKSGEEYANTQKKLLQVELSRQGMSERMSQTMLANFDCIKKETEGQENDPLVYVSARLTCMKNPILGWEKLLDPFKQKVTNAKTLGERIEATKILEREKNVKSTIETTYYNASAFVTPERDQKQVLMSQLVDLHLSLVTTIEVLEKRVPVMQKNCMKGQVDIEGGCKGKR